MSELIDWIQGHPELSTLALTLSVLVLIGTILFSPYLASLIPRDYFNNPERRTVHPHNRAIRVLRIVAKNVFGVALLALGILMLVTPGQGLLTIFVALLALDYPGKYELERWLVQRPGVERGLNWLRAKTGAPPLEISSPD